MTPEPLTIVASWSEVKSWRECHMKHWLSYRMRQLPPPEGKARQIGKVWHSMMQTWYKYRLENPDFGYKTVAGHDQVLDEIYSEFLGWTAESEQDEQVLSTLIWMWEGFLRAGDPFFDWDVVEVEQAHLVPLPRIPGQPEHVTIILKAIIDLVLRRGKRTQVTDHKSSSKKLDPNSTSRDMDMDDQLSMYIAALAMEQAIPARLMSACWNYAVTTDLKKTPRTLEERFWLTYSARSQDELHVAMREFSDSVLDAYARPLAIEPPRHPDKEHCRFMCDWRERCFYARSADRDVELGESEKPDQVPLGLPRVYKQGRE